MNNKIKKLVIIAAFTSFVCIISPISIYIGPIPISLSLFIILIVNGFFNKFEGLLITLLYIAIGIIGIPVFSSYTSGINIILGPTGGYIIGYVICSLVISLFTNLNNNSNVILIISYIIGTMLCYICGITYYIYLMNISLIDAIIVGVFPFILIDTIKISLAFIITIIFKNKLSY